MRRHNENGRELVVYSSDELEQLPRLPGAGREMTDEEITAAAQSDPDTLSQTEDSMHGKTETEALATLFPPETVEELLTPHRGRPKSARPKIQFTVRFDADIVEHFRAGGRGWQARMEETLRKAISKGM